MNFGGLRRRALLAAAGAVLAAVATVATASPALAVDPGGNYPVRGIDTSHYQHPNGSTPIDWNRVAAGGWKFAFVKATQGTSYTDEWFARDLAGAKQAGLPRAPYHFLEAGDGAAQAQHFLQVANQAGYTGTQAGELPPALDLESVGGFCP